MFLCFPLPKNDIIPLVLRFGAIYILSEKLHRNLVTPRLTVVSEAFFTSGFLPHQHWSCQNRLCSPWRRPGSLSHTQFCRISMIYDLFRCDSIAGSLWRASWPWPRCRLVVAMVTSSDFLA